MTAHPASPGSPAFLSGQEEEFEDFLLLNPKGKQRLLEKYADHAVAGRLDLPWLATPYNRVALMARLAARLGSDCRYLEIGCDTDQLFSSLPMAHKIGVDPVKGGNRRMTSDAFFAQNTERFDLVFLDGLHTYGQLRRDVENALAVTRPGGFIGIHDLVPRTWQEEHVPRLSSMWTGDVWKVGVELAQTPGLDFTLVLIDHGVGLIRVGESLPETLTDLSAQLNGARFETFLTHFPDLPQIDWAGLSEWFDGPASGAVSSGQGQADEQGRGAP